MQSQAALEVRPEPDYWSCKVAAALLCHFSWMLIANYYLFSVLLHGNYTVYDVSMLFSNIQPYIFLL